MSPRIRLFFSIFSGVLFLMAALPLYRELSRPSDIWWTPHTLLVPLAESADRVEIYTRGRPIAAVLEAGQLRIVEGADSRVLSAGDFGLRFNNWDRTRAGRLPLLLVNAFACGATALLFLLVVTGRLVHRSEKQPFAAG
jgi:hypothetical protein